MTATPPFCPLFCRQRWQYIFVFLFCVPIDCCRAEPSGTTDLTTNKHITKTIEQNPFLNACKAVKKWLRREKKWLRNKKNSLRREFQTAAQKNKLVAQENKTSGYSFFLSNHSFFLVCLYFCKFCAFEH